MKASGLGWGPSAIQAGWHQLGAELSILGEVVLVVDRRVKVTPKQARGERMNAFFATLYFAALRPGEALGLREQDCRLPTSCTDCVALT